VVRQAIDFIQRVRNDLAPCDKGVPPSGLGRFCLAALRLRQAKMLLSMVGVCVCVLFYAMMLYLDREMLCHERVGLWRVVYM